MADTKTLTLSEFLLARIAEDERVARSAFSDDLGGSYNSPRVDDGRWQTGSHEMDEQRVDGIGITIYDEGGHSTEQAVHIARHDPARVLAECEAKRRIVDEHEMMPVRETNYSGHHEYGDGCCTCCTAFGEYGGPMPDGSPNPCLTLRALALPYANHAGYRVKWRP